MGIMTSGGSSFVDVPQGQKIAITSQNATAVVNYSTFPISPEIYYESSRVVSSSVILGTFPSDKKIRIDVIGAGTVTYDVSATPSTPSVSPYTIAVTNGSAAHYQILDSQSGSFFTNEGATEQVYLDLPAAKQDLVFDFIISDSYGVRITSGSGDTIRLYSDVTPAAGYIESTDIGSTLRIKAINDTEWVVVSSSGQWTPST